MILSPAPLEAVSSLSALAQETGPSSGGSGIPAIDAVGIALVALLAVLGFARGLWWQVIRLIGLGGAVLLARSMTPRLEPWLSQRFPDLEPRLSQGLLWLLLFVAGLAAAALLGRLGRRMLEALQLSLIDRTTGALAGAATGVGVHAALLVVLVQLGPAQWVTDTIGGTWSEGLLEVVSHRFPVLVDGTASDRFGSLLSWEPKAP